MFKYKKLSQTVSKTTLYLHQKPIIILPGLLVMTTGLLHSNIKSQLQNIMVIKYGFNIMVQYNGYKIWNELPLEIKGLYRKS